MDDELKALITYRYQCASETLEAARSLFESGKYRDANNRSYYAVFYAVKAVYALKGQDFKKHKTLLASFNKEYVATEIFPREIGRKVSMLALIREQSDYNDFYIASRQESRQQLEIASEVIKLVGEYLQQQGYDY